MRSGGYRIYRSLSLYAGLIKRRQDASMLCNDDRREQRHLHVGTDQRGSECSAKSILGRCIPVAFKATYKH
jgi:hypothetical protein